MSSSDNHFGVETVDFKGRDKQDEMAKPFKRKYKENEKTLINLEILLCLQISLRSKVSKLYYHDQREKAKSDSVS